VILRRKIFSVYLLLIFYVDKIVLTFNFLLQICDLGPYHQSWIDRTITLRRSIFLYTAFYTTAFTYKVINLRHNFFISHNGWATGPQRYERKRDSFESILQTILTYEQFITAENPSNVFRFSFYRFINRDRDPQSYISLSRTKKFRDHVLLNRDALISWTVESTISKR